MTLEGIQKGLEYQITDILRTTNGIGEYKANSIKRSLAKIVGLFNEEIKQRSGGSKYDMSLKKAVDILALHGYSELDFSMFKEDFLKWFVVEATKAKKYSPDKITKEMLSEFQIQYLLFKLDNEREPNDYNEFRKYLIDNA